VIYARNVRLGRLHDSSKSYCRMAFTGTNPVIPHFSPFGPLRGIDRVPWPHLTPLVTSPMFTQADGPLSHVACPFSMLLGPAGLFPRTGLAARRGHRRCGWLLRLACSAGWWHGMRSTFGARRLRSLYCHSVSLSPFLWDGSLVFAAGRVP
jgi:hypothetical protein